MLAVPRSTVGRLGITHLAALSQTGYIPAAIAAYVFLLSRFQRRYH